MKNIELLELSQDTEHLILKKMKKYSNNYGLLFKIISVDENQILVSISQYNPDSKKIFDKEELVEIGLDVFEEHVLPSQKIIISTNTIEPAPARDVDVDWIKRRMYQTSTKITTMAKDLGLPKSAIEDFFNPKKPLNKMEKNLFFFYLEYRALLKNQDN